ncbi:M48 family metallopeptidase [Geobacter sp. OR-1]|uniref:tetratricopeptide repeat protein n=1 Tax=Geobacter sp. OR-1 TaxID=1266765 RepID=UPI000A9D6BEA|nr:tetratricopeptide repeat protein [Geobacter sp. OR-1]
MLAYIRALSCDFIFFDDPDYVQHNLHIRQLNNELLRTAFTRPLAGYLIPVTFISYAVDYYFWQLNPFGYHLTNMLFHSVNAGLVVIIADTLFAYCLTDLREDPSSRRVYLALLLAAGLFFGIHPLRVESVAWVSGRKDVLYGMFSLGSILFYLRYAHRRDRNPNEKGFSLHYLLSLFCYLLAMLSKPVGVVVPAMLLVMDWYPLRTLRRGMIIPLLVEKIPFFVMAGIMSALTIVTAANEELLYSVSDTPILVRIVVSGNAVFEYCRLLLWPVGISTYHVLAKAIPYSYVAKCSAVLACTGYFIYSVKKRPWLFATWSAFILPLLPVLALIQQGPDAAFAARYTYLPAVIPSIAVAGILGAANRNMRVSRPGFRQLVPVIVIAALIMQLCITYKLIGAWKDTGAFWSRVIEVEPLGRAFQERGFFQLSSGKYQAAAEDFSTAIQIAGNLGMPPSYNLYAFRGEALRKARRYDEAIRDYGFAIELYPHPAYYYHRGLALQAVGKGTDAAADFKRAGSGPVKMDWFD